MKLRWKIIAALVVLAMICAIVLSSRPNSAQRDLQETRRSLQQQGFKTDLAEFNLSLSPELSNRAAMLATTTRAALTNRAGPRPTILGEFRGLLTPAGKDAALVIWKLEKLKGYNSPNLWPELRQAFSTNQARLDVARQAAISGPIRFEPIGRGPGALIPYLSDVKGLATTFGMQTMLALHDGETATAWTNLLAATCLVTEYAPEPIEVSHMVRCACAAIAYDATWNALQSRDWTDAQLVELQRRWESADFWSGLAETAATSRANAVAGCQMERQQPLSLGMMLKEALRSPKYGWPALKAYWQRIRYRHQGSYEDERAWLLYYRDRELELRRAVQCPTWSEMRQLPGVTNYTPFTSKHFSSVQSMMNLRQMNLRIQGHGQGLLGRAADAEGRRRLIVTALALARYRAGHRVYPKALEQLVPEFLKAPPVDFMDGNPLRYRLIDDSHFVIYSVGLDCVDNGGEMPRPTERRPLEFGFGRGSDLVWPRPASAAEAELVRQQEKKAEEEQLAGQEEAQAVNQWARTARRQAKVEAILAAWSTLYESPGKHVLQAGLALDKPKLPENPIVGPLAPFAISNFCQFSLSSATYDPEHGAILHAKLPEPNGVYIIELNSPTGERLKTITGTTTNGIIKVRWDLIDDRGNTHTNDSFGTVFHIDLPDSGRSQTFRGP